MPESLRILIPTQVGTHFHDAAGTAHDVREWEADRGTAVELVPEPLEPGDPPDREPSVMVVFRRPDRCRHVFLRMTPEDAVALAAYLNETARAACSGSRQEPAADRTSARPDAS